MSDTVRIRPMLAGDEEEIQALYNQPSVCEGTLQTPMRPVTWINKMLNNPNSTPLVAEINGHVVGHLGLHVNDNARTRHVGYLGMAVDDQYRRKGIGKALLEQAVDLAQNWLNLHRLELEVFSNNEAAIGLYEAMGFEREGVRRHNAFLKGQYLDAIMMARLFPGPN